MVNWDGVEVSKLAPAFVSDSKNVAIITEWKTRSEASSMRLRRGRGRDGQPVVPAPRPSELPLDWWYDKELLSGLSNMKLPGGTKLDGTMPDKTCWLLAAAQNALWLTVTRRLPLDAACEPLSNIPIQQMFRMGRLPFLDHPLKKEWTCVLKSLLNARQHHWVSDRSRFAPAQPPVTARQRYAAVRHFIITSRARGYGAGLPTENSKLKCCHVLDYVAWFRSRVVNTNRAVVFFCTPEYGWPVVDALDDGVEGVITAALACLDREVVRDRNARRRRRSGGVPDDESAPDTDEAGVPDDEAATGGAGAEVADVDPATAGAEAEVDTQTADASGHAGGGSSLRRPRSTRKRRCPEGVAENDGSWIVDMMRSRKYK